ncbi:MAG: P-loop ATPase [Candidatus Yonathbacteria bacterium]|nr:P-loop ATPase [Candidatus Yonathbacteria bacterium]
MLNKHAIRFKESLSDFRIITANLVVLVKTAFLGILSAEIWGLSLAIAYKLNGWISSNDYEYKAIAVCVAGTLFLVAYLLARGVFADSKKIIRSCRIDVLIIFCFGIWLSIAWGGFLSIWISKIVSSVNITQILTILSGPFILGTLVMGRQLLWKDKKTDSSLVTDIELKSRDNDLLNFTGKANAFAERVFNGGSPESFVFGVDAPWGIGKSTFINFCNEYWEEKYTDGVVVYKFSPLRYLGSANLLEVFIDGLIHAIQKNAFIPEIKPLISRYTRLLKEIKRFSLFGFTLPTFVVDYTADEAFDDLSAVLKRFPRKVIIVIDDLDRISFAEIKDILFVIRKSFAFPNVSYVICYDTENIGVLEADSPDVEKVGEFLEKFVNIKISLYLDREDLKNYVSENLESALTTSIVDPLPVRQAIGGLLEIYDSSMYHRYLPFIGDVRKLKRLINTVMMFDLQSTDFQSSDFNKRDLVNLLLIYIHYPSVFRKIYDTETKGGRGFFSLVIPYDEGYPKDETGTRGRSSSSDSSYKNSTHYHDYLKELEFTEDTPQRFLLDQVFNVDVRLKTDKNSLYGNEYANIDKIPDDVRTSLACFNGGWTNGRNLETYLDLIVNLSKPVDVDQHKFYTQWRDKIINKTVTIDTAFADEKFTYSEGENRREKLWRILVNNARELPSDIAKEIITYLLKTIPEYSLLEMGDPNVGMGLRHNLDYFLTRLLNDAGWIDPQGKHSNNVQPHIAEIAEWVFGEGRHAGSGVLATLSEENRGVLGIHDLLLFRLSCSADRGGDIFDLSRAVAEHANQNAPSAGSTRDIAREEMREISQRVFEIFNTRYILPKKNIFAEIDALQTSNLVGKYDNFLKQKITDGIFQATDIDKKSVELKTRVGAFILYQMANAEINLGAGCGFYDPTGTEDKHTIRDLVNDYLFEHCFDPKKTKNTEYFIDYLFRNFASAFASAREDGLKYIPSINEFIKVLDKVKLSTFWQKHGTTFKNLKLEDKEKVVFVGNDEASYKKYVPMVYKVLDDNVTEVTKVAPTSVVIPASNPVIDA